MQIVTVKTKEEYADTISLLGEKFIGKSPL